jgi:hypothetical protein
MKDFIKVETKRKFVTGMFKVRSAYYVKKKEWEHGVVCLLTSKSPVALDFIYVNEFENIQNLTLRPDDFIDDNITITEAIYKVDIPEVKIISEWKTVKEAFTTPGYFNNGDCYEFKQDSYIGPFAKIMKGFLSKYYPTSEKLRFVVNSVDTNVSAIKRRIDYLNVNDSYEIVESSITNGMIVDIIVPDTTDDVKIRRLS